MCKQQPFFPPIKHNWNLFLAVPLLYRTCLLELASHCNVELISIHLCLTDLTPGLWQALHDRQWLVLWHFGQIGPKQKHTRLQSSGTKIWERWRLCKQSDTASGKLNYIHLFLLLRHFFFQPKRTQRVWSPSGGPSHAFQREPSIISRTVLLSLYSHWEYKYIFGLSARFQLQDPAHSSISEEPKYIRQ